jgi:hypothetical protein
VWIRLASDYPGEAAAAGLVDLLIDNQDLTEACMIFDNSR